MSAIVYLDGLGCNQLRCGSVEADLDPSLCGSTNEPQRIGDAASTENSG